MFFSRSSQEFAQTIPVFRFGSQLQLWLLRPEDEQAIQAADRGDKNLRALARVRGAGVASQQRAATCSGAPVRERPACVLDAARGPAVRRTAGGLVSQAQVPGLPASPGKPAGRRELAGGPPPSEATSPRPLSRNRCPWPGAPAHGAPGGTAATWTVRGGGRLRCDPAPGRHGPKPVLGEPGQLPRAGPAVQPGCGWRARAAGCWLSPGAGLGLAGSPSTAPRPTAGPSGKWVPSRSGRPEMVSLGCWVQALGSAPPWMA